MNERQKALKRQYLAAERARERQLVPLTDAELDDLLDFLDESLGAQACGHSFSLARQWLGGNGKDEDALNGFGELGAYCDCEVLANIDRDRF